MARYLIVEDVDTTVNGLHLVDVFHDVTRLQVHTDRVVAISDVIVPTLDFGEGCLKAVLCMGQ